MSKNAESSFILFIMSCWVYYCNFTQSSELFWLEILINLVEQKLWKWVILSKISRSTIFWAWGIYLSQNLKKVSYVDKKNDVRELRSTTKTYVLITNQHYSIRSSLTVFYSISLHLIVFRYTEKSRGP